jgi:hypothetical protein
VLAKQKARYYEDPKKQQHTSRRGHLRRTYGLTEAQYHAMVVAQGGVCAICFKPEAATHFRTGTSQSLAVDHDHSSNRVRALLCTRCNKALGQFEDNIATLHSAIAYLTRFSEKTT